MYEVFVNEHPIFLTNKLTKESDYKLFLLDTFNIDDVIKQLNKGVMKAAYLYHPDEEQLLRKLKSKIPLVVAAGGLVKNDHQETLFIFRNGKWDLPKGKLDKGESLEEAAIREVEEETGIKGLKLGKFLQKTYHIFKRNGSYRLKETHWYAMKSNYKGPFTAQCDEGIEQVEWKNDAQIAEALENSYRNIVQVIKNQASSGLPQHPVSRVF